MRSTTVFFFALSLVGGAVPLLAQQLIALQHAGNSSFFTELPAALDAAMDGDTLYLPGRSYPGFTLNKRLSIIGAGHHPDSTRVTAKTIINGNITFSTGAENSYITGIHAIEWVIFDENVSNITVQRCYMRIGFTGIGVNTGLVFSENVIGSHGVWVNYNWVNYSIGDMNTNIKNSAFYNNIIFDLIKIDNSNFENNIILNSGCVYVGSGNFLCLSMNSCIINNNTSYSIDISIQGTNMISLNNINMGLNGADSYGNQGANNIFGVNPDSLFVQFAPPWDYTDNFHLVNPAYNTGGTDGTPIGIYGGVYPWKDGSLPFNPHIQFKSIGSTTDPNGNLLINIQVKAQDH